MDALKRFWLEQFDSENPDWSWWDQFRKLNEKRQAKLVRVRGKGHLYQWINYDRQSKVYYHLHLSMFLKQEDYFYREERIIPLEFILKSGKIIEHQITKNNPQELPEKSFVPELRESQSNERFNYNRLAAVQYAERWWNSYNPQYRKFEVDCTNYISQCLRAGGAPMRGAPNRSKGWWYSGNNWSYSWAVAHAMRWYLAGSTQGLKGTEVQSPSELQPGDVICYDFEGDGKWDHTTIVVAKDGNGMPLVNAHTQNSRHRYWSYEDSTAYTPNIQYKFFRIGD